VTSPIKTTKRVPNVTHASGLVSSSRVPPFHYITTHSLERLAARCQLGVDRRPDGTSWNAMKPEKTEDVAHDTEAIMDRIDHGIKHLLLLRDKIVTGADPLADDDDAAAVLWCAMFLCEITRVLSAEKSQ